MENGYTLVQMDKILKTLSNELGVLNTQAPILSDLSLSHSVTRVSCLCVLLVYEDVKMNTFSHIHILPFMNHWRDVERREFATCKMITQNKDF